MRKVVLLGTIATVAALALVVMAPLAFAGSGTQVDPFVPGDKTPFCHYDGSETGGGSGKYNMPDASTTATGPAGHIGHAFDVIPSYWFQQNQNSQAEFYAGVNWPTLNNLPSSPVDFTPLLGSSAATFIASGCAEPVASTTVPPTSTTVPPTSTTAPPTSTVPPTSTTVPPTSTATQPPPASTSTPPPPVGGPGPGNNPPPNNPPVQGPPLAFTGPEAALPIGALAVALAGVGSGLMWLSRKRRDDE